MQTTIPTGPALEAQIRADLRNWASTLSKFRKPDARKSIGQLASSFGPYLLVWILMYLFFDYTVFLPLLAVVGAFFLARIFIIQHDCGHQSFFGGRKWNIITGWVCCFFTLIPYRYWAALHRFHHVHSSELEDRDIGDITMLTVREYQQLSSLAKWKYRVYRSVPVLLILGPLYYVVIHLRIPVIRFQCGRPARIEAILTDIAYLVFYGSLCFVLGWQKLLYIQGSILCLFSIMAVWFFYVQHQHDLNYKRPRSSRDYLLAAIKGSTYYKLPRLFMWLTGNIGYHHIHHLNPAIPNYHLEQCVLENPRLQLYTTEVGFLTSLTYVRHKLWDEEQDKMITFREYKIRYHRD